MTLTPLLKTSRVEDFLELTQKYEKKFKNLSCAISRIIAACKNNSEIDKILIAEIKSSTEDIASLYEAKRKELEIKGISFLVGIGLTLIPVGLSTILSFDPTLVSSTFGSVNLLSFKPALEKYFIDRYEISNDPFWILWKFDNMSKKRKTKK